MIFNTVVICGPGRVRRQNQDNFFFNGVYRGRVDDTRNLIGVQTGLESAVLAVCDGMGGESHGELASLETARTLRLCAARGSVDME